MAAPVEGDKLVAVSLRAAQAAAERSTLVVREVADVAEVDALGLLLTAIWDPSAGTRTLSNSLLKALATTGHYVAGAFHDGVIVGGAVAFFDAPLTMLHSHIAGADPAAPVTGIGYALKLHQRAWALARGAATITWTFDPLVRRNAHFNITKLGAEAKSYLPNYYGAMDDGRNAGEESDRLYVEWDLRRHGADEPPVPPARVLEIVADGAPAWHPWSGGRALLAIPPDIERMRREDSGLAHRWRLAVREALGGTLADGGRIVGFCQGHGYVIDRSAI
jgi:predicted GNAT superfamily acetyltransferase